jgi:glycine hydroxymethyltransferase
MTANSTAVEATRDVEVHDIAVLQWASDLLDRAAGPRGMQQEVLAAVARNARWRGEECLNLLAPEAPMSPVVRELLASEVGQRAAEGHIGPANRWFAGTLYIDEIEALELTVDLDAFALAARKIHPALVSLGASMTLFPFPVADMTKIVAEWGGRIFFDGAHQLGLIAGGQFQDPLAEGAAVLTGSAGKTFSGPQSGVIVWNDPELTVPLTETIFPALAATHQVNRVAALAAAAAEFLAFGREYMAQIVSNAQALAAALHERGVPMLAAHKGFTRTHQAIADVRAFGGGEAVAFCLAEANIITNKNLIPADRPQDWNHPSGLRIGTTEITRWGMREPEMAIIAGLIADLLHGQRAPSAVQQDVIALRRSFPTLQFCFPDGGQE